MRRRAKITWLAAVSASAAVLGACTSSAPAEHQASSSSRIARPGTSTGMTITSTASGSPSPSASPRVAPKLHAFRIADVTFVGNQQWALGTADCLSGNGRCAGIEHSSDGGASWASLPTPAGTAVQASGAYCRDRCIASIRFATPQIGYLFGATPGSPSLSPLYVTHDGGLHWAAQAGGAVALESLDGNVIRISTATGGCPPGCVYRAQTGPLSGTKWHRRTLPGRASQGDGAQLARTDSHAFLLTVGNPAGGANNEKSVLYTSADDGDNWVNRGEPCPQGGNVPEVDSFALTTAPDGSVSVLCRQRLGGGRIFVATSTNSGATFSAPSRNALGSAPVSAFAAASASVLLLSSDDTYRSTDGGRHFTRLSANGGSSPGQLDWLGFATPTLGHAVSSDHRRLWTTTDGGQTWQAHRFS